MKLANKIYKSLLLFFALLLFVGRINIYAEENTKSTTEEETKQNEIIDNNGQINENTNSRYKIIIEDNANLLTEDEEKKLYDEMAPLSEFGHIAFLSIQNNDEANTRAYGIKFYLKNFKGGESGSVFIIDMDKRQVTLLSYGYNYSIITDDKSESITDNVYRYASREEYYECASKVYSQMLALLHGKKIAEPMRITSDIFIAITVAAFINFFIVMSKSKMKVAKDKEILKNCKIDFKIGEIKGVKTGTRRVYSPPVESSSSGGFSGGGSSGGGGGGGGFSGGGGGHGF